MLGIIIVSHVGLAEAFIKSAEFILGPQENVVSLSVPSDDNPESVRQELCTLIDKVNTDNGVIILTDTFGGTPSNIAISCLQQHVVEVIAGVNLPMLIKLLSVRQQGSVTKTAQAAVEAGRQYITIASEFLNDDRCYLVASA